MQQSTTDLALQRTRMANQRTFMAYLRTGFSMIGLGWKFNMKLIVYIGMIFLVLGLWQYHSFRDGSENNIAFYLTVPAIIALLGFKELF